MKKHLLIITIALISGLSACSEENQSAEEASRAEHYEAEIPKTEKDAIEQLNKDARAIAQILKTNGLGAAEMEEIHEISYSLEASVDKLAETKDVAKLDEAVQALHFASENQNEGKTRQWYGQMRRAKNNLKDKAEQKKGLSYDIIIKDHKFNPTEIKVPAGEKIKLLVDNQDPTPEEFESHDMNREKIIGGNKKATIYVGPLEPGKYHFFGEFNMDSANGYIIAE